MTSICGSLSAAPPNEQRRLRVGDARHSCDHHLGVANYRADLGISDQVLPGAGLDHNPHAKVYYPFRKSAIHLIVWSTSGRAQSAMPEHARHRRSADEGRFGDGPTQSSLQGHRPGRDHSNQAPGPTSSSPSTTQSPSELVTSSARHPAWVAGRSQPLRFH
jgi:hypothetical protein